MEEEMRKNWTGSRFSRPNDDVIDRIVNGKCQTALQNLARRYHVFSNIALVMICWSVFIFFTDIYPERWRLMTSIAFGVYFLTVSVMDYWLYRGISEIDLLDMDMKSVMLKVAFYRKRHLQFVAILLPMAIALVIFILQQFTSDLYMIACITFGLLIGLAIGSRQLMKFLSDYRTLIKELGD